MLLRRSCRAVPRAVVGAQTHARGRYSDESTNDRPQRLIAGAPRLSRADLSLSPSVHRAQGPRPVNDEQNADSNDTSSSELLLPVSPGPWSLRTWLDGPRREPVALRDRSHRAEHHFVRPGKSAQPGYRPHSSARPAGHRALSEDTRIPMADRRPARLGADAVALSALFNVADRVLVVIPQSASRKSPRSGIKNDGTTNLLCARIAVI